MDHKAFHKNMAILYKKVWGNKKNNQATRLSSASHYGDDCGSLLYPPVTEQWVRDNISKISPNGFMYKYCLDDSKRELVDTLIRENKGSHNTLVKRP